MKKWSIKVWMEDHQIETCHGQPNLQMWTPLKTSEEEDGWSHATSGIKETNQHESCDWKSGLFHQILIPE